MAPGLRRPGGAGWRSRWCPRGAGRAAAAGVTALPPGAGIPVLAALLPAHLLRRLPTAQLLARD